MFCRKLLSLHVLLFAVLALSACNGGKPFKGLKGQEDESLICPRTDILDNTGRMPLLGPDGTPAAGFAILDYSGSCEIRSVSAGTPRAVMNLAIRMQAKGHGGQNLRDVTARYFAIVTDPEGDLLMKDIMSLRWDKIVSERARTKTAEIALEWPLPDPDRLSRHQVFIGFQLSRDQLHYNRMQTPRPGPVIFNPPEAAQGHVRN